VGGAPPPVDWSVGRYETLADQLGPISEHVIALAAPRANETLLDIACGTGNAALLGARSGAIASGVDNAERLIEVAAARAAAAGLTANFAVADAEALPFADAAFDVVVSVMGVIYAPDARRALAEALRVLRPGGRAFVSAWCPGGAIDAMVGVMMSGLAEVLGPSPARFRWGDADAVGAFARELGADASFHDGSLAFTADSPEAYLAEQERDQPSFHWSRQVLAEHGSDPEPLRSRVLAALREHNEAPSAFRATSRYHVIELRHA
jgi:SAM-dependent methyltransferase